MRKRGGAVMFQIDEQKRQVVENVDGGEGLVELEAIEQCRLPIEQTDIAEVQIAVAVAHLAGCTAAIEQLRCDLQMSAPFLENDAHLITAEPGAVRRCQATILHVGETGHLRRAAVIKVPLGGSVKLGNMVGKLIHY